MSGINEFGGFHDSPRLLTSIQNRNKYKYHCKPAEDKNYLTNIPDPETYSRAILLVIHQFTFLGTPHIWNGDEMGMLGADDPDNRKPLIWPDIVFESETASSFQITSMFSNQYSTGLCILYLKTDFFKKNMKFFAKEIASFIQRTSKIQSTYVHKTI